MAEEFRQAMSRLVSGVAVIAARSGRHDVAITATSVTSVSLDPPMLLFTVHRDARLRDCVEVGDRWAVSILGAGGRAAASWLSEPGRPLLDQLSRVPHRLGEGSGAAILDSATAWVEARTAWIAAAGTHDVVCGDVIGCGVNPANRGAVLHARGQLEVLDA